MRRNVLVVDDDPHVQDLVKFFLEQAGYVVRICKDGFSALDELMSNPYDVIILDIWMPHLNGLKTLKSIRANPNTKDLPVLMLTSSQDKSDVLKAKDQHVTDYVIKPPQRDDLLNRLERVLGGRPQYEEIRISEEESLANGSFLMPFKVKSISQNGLIFTADSAMSKGKKVQISNFELFKTLNFEKTELLIADCTPCDDGKFEFFVSFLGLKKEDQENLRAWIMSQTHRRRN